MLNKYERAHEYCSSFKNTVKGLMSCEGRKPVFNAHLLRQMETDGILCKVKCLLW